MFGGRKFNNNKKVITETEAYFEANMSFIIANIMYNKI